jgi:acyl carrier protein/RimJ/RimL family protein N-acetyltransferase
MGSDLVHGNAKSIEGRRYILRAAEPSDYPALYRIASAPPALHTGRLDGRTIPYEEFCRQLWSGVLAQFVISPIRTAREVVGLITADSHNAARGVAYLSILVSSDRRKSSTAMAEATWLFVHYCFSNFPLRKIYAETTEAAIPEIGKIVDRYLSVHLEGRLIEDRLIDGRWVDTLVLAIWRDQFFLDWNARCEERISSEVTSEGEHRRCSGSARDIVEELWQEFPELRVEGGASLSMGVGDLGWDSMALLEVLDWCECRFGIDIPDTGVNESLTLGDLIEFCSRQL